MSVTFRIVKTALEAQCRVPGGKRISAALADAYKNLEILAPETLKLIDAGLAEISSLLDTPDQTRPADSELIRIGALSDELAGYCAAVNVPELDGAFLRLCQLADAVRLSHYWRDGTFGPLLVVLNLARHQTMPPSDLQTLFKGIDQCTEMYLAASPEADTSSDAGVGTR